MSAERCSGCGAPLADSKAPCPFCGVVTATRSVVQAPPQEGRAVLSVERETITFSTPAEPIRTSPVIDPVSSDAVKKVGAAAGKSIGCLMLLAVAFGIFLACFVASCIGNMIGSSSTSPTPPPSSSSASDSGTPAAGGVPTGLTPQALRTAPAGTHPLAVAEPSIAEGRWRPSFYREWDPIEQLGWAREIAKGWSSEATLQRIDVTGASGKGLLDVSKAGGSEVIYRFWPSVAPTPARTVGVEKDRRAESAPTVAAGTELWVRVSKGSPVALISALTPPEGAKAPNVWDDDQPDVNSLALQDIFTKLAARRGFNGETTYSGFLEYEPRDGWVWTLSQASGAALPRVLASDGRTLAARRPR